MGFASHVDLAGWCRFHRCTLQLSVSLMAVEGPLGQDPTVVLAAANLERPLAPGLAAAVLERLLAQKRRGMHRAARRCRANRGTSGACPIAPGSTSRSDSGTQPAPWPHRTCDRGPLFPRTRGTCIRASTFCRVAPSATARGQPQMKILRSNTPVSKSCIPGTACCSSTFRRCTQGKKNNNKK